MISVGSKAPDFVLKDQNGREFKLSESRGKKVLLSFTHLPGQVGVPSKCNRWKQTQIHLPP